jgi:aspartate carbamoyltransferase regulatory subunit
MKKRFLHVCKNPACKKEFAIIRSKFIHDKAGQIRLRCPHCKKLQKIVVDKRGKF